MTDRIYKVNDKENIFIRKENTTKYPGMLYQVILQNSLGELEVLGYFAKARSARKVVESILKNYIRVMREQNNDEVLLADCIGVEFFIVGEENRC